ncbi:hypothetical protein L0156_00880, partial [bacterium]|nr:hypothetical protein [bacterium]
MANEHLRDFFSHHLILDRAAATSHLYSPKREYNEGEGQQSPTYFTASTRWPKSKCFSLIEPSQKSS